MNRLTTLIPAAAMLFVAACSGDQAPIFASGVFEATEVIVSSEATGRLLEFTPVEGLEIAAGDVIGKVDCRQI
ncbi:MAG TPA: hypothetical protein PKH54_07055, partial [Myxococcota bacterium]|nr:hypothetical protein [Myxococcota bacterium]